MDGWIINGERLHTLDVNDRGLAYGDGLFETIAIRAGRCRFLSAHLERLRHGCERLAIPAPTARQLELNARQLIDEFDCAHGTLKIIVTRGPGERGYRYDPDHLAPNVILGVAGAAKPSQLHHARVRYCHTRVSRNPALAGIKTLNRLPQVLARAEWTDPNIDEGLMSDDRDNLIGGTMTNLFIVREQTLMTPPVDECGIAGVMRSQLLAQAGQLGIDSRECYFGTTELAQATEVFLSNSLVGIWPVRQIDTLEFAPGLVTTTLQQALANLRDNAWAE